ncbi:FkbM family methyltransferase [uncultured Selenomonas sp.]|uniref:FkbM family methyltransferase n=1 Tax=uncultured Selenomonas sp. TaxID=159275 RepID=UPI0025F023E5|nr:FkbM family methyltransferase [uncultured Selenomonas sp.]
MRQFLRAVSDFHEKDYLHRLRDLAAKKAPCGFFYLGNDADLPKFLNILHAQGITVSVIVNLGGELPSAGVPVIHAAKFPALAEKPQTMILYGAGVPSCFASFFERWDIECLVLNVPQNIQHDTDFYDQHLVDLYEAYSGFHDEESRLAFLGGWKYVSSSSIRDFHLAPEPQYFLSGFTVLAGDIVIDGGAYDGGTSRDFASVAGASGKVYAFEMDEENFKKCQAAAEHFGFVAENMGLASHRQMAKYMHTGAQATASRMDAGGDRTASFTSIDVYVKENQLPRVDFIKMDIEGAELDALHGAALTIARWKPRMAICAYHKPEDLWVLQQYIQSLRPDYEFAFRHYGIDVSEYLYTDETRQLLSDFHLPWSVPSNCERVLYCR